MVSKALDGATDLYQLLACWGSLSFLCFLIIEVTYLRLSLDYHSRQLLLLDFG